MAKHGKRYDTAKEQIRPEGNYAPLDAFRLLTSFEVARFDATVEAHFRLGVNVRHAEEQLRGTIALPHGTGRQQIVAVRKINQGFADEGSDFRLLTGSEVDILAAGRLDFEDDLLAELDQARTLARHGIAA